MKLAQFPVDSDRTFVSWVSVELGRSEDATLVLRNRLSTQLNLTLVIRESQDFKLNSCQSGKIVLGPLSTTEVVVTFCPSLNSGAAGNINGSSMMCHGKLILKPLLGGPGKPMRATIQLQGCVGAPKLGFSGFGDFLKENRLLNLGDLSAVGPGQIVQRKMLVRNTGTAVAFVKLVPFLDPECRIPAAPAVFDIVPKEFLVPIGAEIGIVLQLLDLDRTGLEKKNSSKNSFLGTIAIFHGSEMARLAMVRARRLEGASRLSFAPNLLGKNQRK